MDFHAAMETFAEAWVAANTQTAVNSDPQALKQTSVEDLPTLLPKDQLVERGQGGNSNTGPGGGNMVLGGGTTGPGGVNSGSSGAATGTAGSHVHRVEKSSSPKKPDTTTQASGGSGKSLPIHCLVEQISGVPSFAGVTSSTCTGSQVELDSYAILPCSTLLGDLVRTALLKLGYSATDAMNAKGAIQIKNWKPLTFDAITDGPQSTVDDILSELTNVATLRIRLASPPKASTAEEIKDKLLQLLLSHSQGLLNEAGCPIEKTLLSSLSRGEKPDSLSDEVLNAFDKWYRDQLTRRQRPPPLMQQQQQQQQQPQPKTADSDKLMEPVKPASPIIPSSESKENHTTSPLFNHCRTRIRTSFDPEHEIPRLQKWFQDNQHPSREQMIQYMNELNSLDSRKGRRPLDLTNIIYWFKNARAAQRRASKAMDDSFENEENGDVAPSSIPYLPNKNAVYMIPFPFNSHIMPSDGQADEPCDLSVAKKREEEVSEPQEKSQPVQDSIVPMKSFNGNNINIAHSPYEATIKRETPDSCQNENETEAKSDMGYPCMNGSAQSSVESSQKQEREVDNFNNNHDDEKMEDVDQDDVEDDEYESSDDMSDVSISGDEPISMLKKEHDSEHDYRNAMMMPVSVANSSAANMAALSLAQMAQPLHVPQLPPPLMTYYPVNARFYSPQSNSLPHGPQQHNSPHKHHETRKRRTRVFIDPLTEIPKLEKWFLEDTHPSAYMIDKYCEELNRSEYRAKFPRLEPKNVQLWFKNHRAKVKRMRLSA